MSGLIVWNPHWPHSFPPPSLKKTPKTTHTYIFEVIERTISRLSTIRSNRYQLQLPSPYSQWVSDWRIMSCHPTCRVVRSISKPISWHIFPGVLISSPRLTFITFSCFFFGLEWGTCQSFDWTNFLLETHNYQKLLINMLRRSGSFTVNWIYEGYMTSKTIALSQENFSWVVLNINIRLQTAKCESVGRLLNGKHGISFKEADVFVLPISRNYPIIQLCISLVHIMLQS